VATLWLVYLLAFAFGRPLVGADIAPGGLGAALEPVERTSSRETSS
jgi:hypothetical protein